MQLDEYQQQAVEFYKGQVIVIAGAGSGKTKCATERIARLIERGETPESILAFTFTNAAADEMKKRLSAKLGDEMVARLNIGTMHSQLNKILRANIQFWRPDMHKYEIMDEYGCRKLVQEAQKACGLPEDSIVNIANGMKAVSFVKNEAVSVEEVKDGIVDGLLKQLGVIDWFVDFFETYESMRRMKKLVGFDDMLWDTYFMLREKVNILNTYAEKFKFLLVDEFQDTNKVQFELVKMLQSKHKNLFTVGDPRQSIYKFRGADVTLSLEFKKHFPGSHTIELLNNYRSVSNIVELSNDLISNANYPFQPTKFTRPEGKIEFVGSFQTDNEEAESITEEIKALYVDGVKYNDIIILTRTNAQSRPFEEKFVKNKIPYRSLDGTFYESANVKDMLCFLKLIVGDNFEAFKRVYNKPNRYLGKVFFEEFSRRYAPGKNIVQILMQGGFPKNFMNKGAATLAAELKLLRSACAMLSPGKAIEMIRKMLQYDEWLTKNEMDASSRIEILNELQSSAMEYPSIKEYLEFVELIIAAQQSKEDYDAVRIMTVHRSKGLEAPVVFVAGVCEGVLPHGRAEDVQEERRICYVAVTRAIDRLYVSYFLERFKKELAPSRFINEMMLEQRVGRPLLGELEVAA